MNLNECIGSFLFKSPSSPSHSFIPKTGNVYMFVIANMQSFSSRIFGVVSPLGENLDFLLSVGTQKIKLYSVRALKRYLNEKNLTHGE